MERDKDKVTIKEGVLLKRQRGLHSRSLKKLKFQERYCMLFNKSLYYYDGEKEKGSFEMDRIKIVEAVPPATFKKDFCIQVGDDAEVLYFVTKSKLEMEEWIHAFREAASNNDNIMFPRYHTGAYGLLSHGKWSCCNQAQRQTKGCKQAFAYQVNRSHTLQAQGTKNTAATELATQCRPTSFPCCLSNYPPPALPQRETLPPFPEGFRARCHSSITKSESPRMSSLLEDLHKRATISTMTPSNECASMVKLGRQHYENNSVPSIADSGTGESLQKLPKSTESLVSASSSGLSEAYILQSPETEQKALEDIQMNTETEKEPETKKGSTLDSLYEEEEQYTLLQCFTPTTQNVVQALEFCRLDKMISTSYGDSYVCIWDISSFKPVQSVKVSSSVLALDVWSHYLAIGSSVVQMVDMSSDELRRILFVEDSEGIPSSPLPSHFVAFVGEEGHLVTARADSTVVKVWPPPPQDSRIITSPEAHIPLTGQIQGLSATHKSQASLLAVTVEKKDDETCCKSVCLIDWKKHEDYKIIASSGNPSVRIHTAFSPDARQVSTGIGKEVAVWETGSGTDLYHFNTDAPVCSIVYSHDGSKLAVGLSTGEVEVFDPTSYHHLFTLRDPVACTEGLSPATSLAYSGDDKMFASGYQSGRLKFWKASTEGLGTSDATVATSQCLKNSLSLVHGMEFYNDLEPLLARVETLDQQFNENGTYEYQSIDDNIKLIIPEGAIVGDHKVQVAVMKYGPIGPFEYPDGYKPVSPIVWLCSNQKKFQKDLELILPHCSDLGNSDEEASQTQLVFMKASHEYIHNKNDQKVFQFKQVDAQSSFNVNDPYGSLHINHCCYFCVGVYNREDTDQANFCLTVVKPRVTTSNYIISICLMLDLPTCRNALHEQYPAHDFKIQDIYTVKFAIRNPATALEIEVDRQQTTTAGWQIALVTSRIKVEDVFGFWDNFKTTAALVEACRNKLYPPRFKIEVYGEEAIKSTHFKVTFKGGVDELKTEILLERPTRWTPPVELVVPRSQLHRPTGSEGVNPAGISFSSEHESPEDSRLHQQLHSFNGYVQNNEIDPLD